MKRIKDDTVGLSESDNTYNSVKIGNQEWMTENLNVSTFKNVEQIPEAKTDKEWKKAGKKKQPAWCYYENDPAKGKKYGKLYNWYAVNDARGLAPEGWHVPTKEEFETLITTVNNDENSLKAVGQGIDNSAGTNISGFSTLLAGSRGYDGFFYQLGVTTYFWSSTELDAADAIGLGLSGNDSGIRHGYDDKELGFSVRCVKD